MGKFVKGDVVVLPFPFSNLVGSKSRPALVISDSMGDDIILCQITASRSDYYTIELRKSDFSNGSLSEDTSYIRTNKIFTADKNIIVKSVGTVKPGKYRQVVEKIVTVIS